MKITLHLHHQKNNLNAEEMFRNIIPKGQIEIKHGLTTFRAHIE